MGQRGASTYQGIVVADGTGLAVNVNGNTIFPIWQDPVVVAVGDSVLVDISRREAGGGQATVRSRVASLPRPATGEVASVPPSSPTITVTGTDGLTYTATFADSYTPVVGDNVLLSWDAALPSVIGKVGIIVPSGVPPAPPVVAPPGTASTGTEHYAATDSGTYVPTLGGWDRWAGGGGHVYQGSYAGHTMYGAWFYSGSGAQLAGRIWTAIRFTLGSRRPVGSNNSPVTLHFWAHTNVSKPGGDVTRVTGPYTVVIQPNAGKQTFDLPTTFAGAIAGGGGIAISGEPYAGVNGCFTQGEPDSGALDIDWAR